MLHAGLIPSPGELDNSSVKGNTILPVCCSVEGILRFVSVEGAGQRYSRVFQRLAQRYLFNRIRETNIGATSDELRAGFLNNKLFRDDVIAFILGQRDKATPDHRSDSDNIFFQQTVVLDELRNMSQKQVSAMIQRNANDEDADAGFKRNALQHAKKIRKGTSESGKILRTRSLDSKRPIIQANGVLGDVYIDITLSTVWEACRAVSMRDPFMSIYIDDTATERYTLKELHQILQACATDHPDRQSLVDVLEKKKNKS